MLCVCARRSLGTRAYTPTVMPALPSTPGGEYRSLSGADRADEGDELASGGRKVQTFEHEGIRVV